MSQYMFMYSIKNVKFKNFGKSFISLRVKKTELFDKKKILATKLS